MRKGRFFKGAIAAGALLWPLSGAAAADLTKQTPIEVRVALGNKAGAHVFQPSALTFETGKLYKLVLTNPSGTKHYFTSPGLARSVYTRKVQVVDGQGTKVEIKGTIREIEVYPGGVAEWWFVPVAAGRFNDLHCHIRGADGRTHAEHGMRGSVTIR
ncbi:MAG: hypothetical protein Kow0032_22850 [Methyloligellaceae bacterium]